MAEAGFVSRTDGGRSHDQWMTDGRRDAASPGGDRGGGAGTAADGFGKDWLLSDRAAKDPFNFTERVAGYASDPWGEEAERDWQERALCSQTDPEAFFPEKGGSTREAKKICTGCEVRAECLEYALAHDERFGIWGGLSERERRKLRKRAV